MEVHTYNLSNLEADAGEYQVPGHPGQKQKQTEKKGEEKKERKKRKKKKTDKTGRKEAAISQNEN